MIRLAVAVALGLACCAGASAQNVSACAWNKAPNDIRQEFLRGYHLGMQTAMTTLQVHDGELQALVASCAPKAKVPKLWGSGAIGSQAIEEGALQELPPDLGLDRARLDRGWDEMPEAARDCYKANAGKVFGVRNLTCPDNQAVIKGVEALGVNAKSSPAAFAQLLTYYNAKAQSLWVDALIARAAADPKLAGPQ